MRTVLETLDKVSLFIKFPENIDIFLGDDQEYKFNSEMFFEFINNHLIPWAVSEGIDPTEIMDALIRFPFGEDD